MTAVASDTPSPAPSRKPLYEGSTQYKNWRYAPAQLAAVRARLNSAAVAAIRATFEADEPGSAAGVAFLDAEEELLLVKLYASRVAPLCGHFRFAEEVEATAVTYLKRFYLKNTVMDWHPKNVMLTALFLATKTTNNPISLEAYTSRIPKTAPSDVLDLEFLVAQSLGFEFAVWHAHRALWGLWLDLQSIPEIAPEERAQEVYDAALSHVRSSRLTDAELIYTPSQIALACLSLASPSVASRWVASKPGLTAALPATVSEVQALLATSGQAPDVEAVRAVDRRLKLCKNPAKVPGSRAFAAREAAEERRAEEKRGRKAEAARLRMEEGDPFGEEIKEGGVDEEDDDDD